ncbi:unnamed protein product [Eruca vesicaria subsp. sativa]|uniref:chorismate mutase n=1 Tax=Eruca vesicaria subsp. sativa TaxID=29727 RepID=A0ABC8JGZ9_ERUVS|nr:unnamed protein product [Eruca vesicaria subsp. sativa]
MRSSSCSSPATGFPPPSTHIQNFLLCSLLASSLKAASHLCSRRHDPRWIVDGEETSRWERELDIRKYPRLLDPTALYSVCWREPSTVTTLILTILLLLTCMEGFNGSLVEYIVKGTEKLHAKVGRYKSPDEHPFFPDDLPEHVKEI